MAKVKYAGVKINLGGEDFIIPALSTGQAEEVEVEMAAINADFSAAVADGKAPFSLYIRWIPIYLMAIQRNYPEITEARLRSDVDLTNHLEIQRAILGIDKDTLTRGE